MSNRRIYTSDFKSIKGCEELQTVSLSRYPPIWYEGFSYPDFFPPEDIVTLFRNHEITSLEYTTVFVDRILSKLNPQVVIKDLLDLAPGKDIILCCWGRPDEYCHRHLVASWINAFLVKNSDLVNLDYIREITLEDCYHVDNADYDYN